ncbi:hypothetical protein [Roseivirga sp. E12]|uniref:hypothetical protein n=1 Tax=Roseivirga sp. E12 TaxID=2819237 RepID=UPI001ABC4896|nr:hypothetical protein [Roseivirga sp. E12]MBO3698571.1 hypothetical protein [Roseivirga sp. E12]
MKKMALSLLLTLLIISCAEISHDDLNGKWQVLVDDGEYYERWVSDTLVIWLNSQGQIETWVTRISGNELIYEQSYNKALDEFGKTELVEKIKVQDHENLKINLKSKSDITYRLIKINDQVFMKDFRLIDFDEVLKEFKKRQYQYFELPNK